MLLMNTETTCDVTCHLPGRFVTLVLSNVNKYVDSELSWTGPDAEIELCKVDIVGSPLTPLVQ